MKLKIFFILFLCLISEGIEGANLPQSVAPIQPTSSNVGELAPASYENANGVKYPNVPFYGNPKITHKGKVDGLGKVDTSNRFSVLQGLTEENQDKMFGKSEIKPKIEEECEEDCEEECVEEVVIDTSQLNTKQASSAIKKPNRKLLQYERERPSYKEDRPNFSDRTNTCCCCCPNWVKVIVIGALTLPGLLFNYSGNVMDCKISPDFGINRNLPSCVKIDDSISCNSNYFLWVHSKDFHKHFDKNETFGLYCPIGKNNSMDKVAEAVVTRVKDKVKGNGLLLLFRKISPKMERKLEMMRILTTNVQL
ncbi:unnamed protein product [Meloidogyne enterolobii]|uniref:Uncharacterized protein n=1 Tax=Meloidogyne enterolobii TaxID=390850 RepID=A0ACB0ZG03_MELEN